MKRILKYDWDIIAGITASGLAIILHLLHIVHQDVLLTITLVLLALLLLRDLRRESKDEEVAQSIKSIRAGTQDLQMAIRPPESILIGPRNLRSESQRFCETSHGEMIWFNVCFLMFKRQEVFDLMLRPAIENPKVTSIQFTSDGGQEGLWNEFMLPKIKQCIGNEKVTAPNWRTLPETLSFILADTENGKTEALLSFWGDPFMAKTFDKQLPRYVFRIQGHSDLVGQLVEVERKYRMDMQKE